MRAQVASERDEQARRRDQNAHRRDQIALERDQSAAGADEVAGQLAWAVKDPDGKTLAALAAAAKVRSRAAAARTRAALDREAAGRDARKPPATASCWWPSLSAPNLTS